MESTNSQEIFATRLEQLFSSILNKEGKRYTLDQISQRAADRGYHVSSTFLSHLRTSRAKAPSFKTVEAISAAFGVDIRFFLNDGAGERTQAELDYARLQADPQIHALAYRVAGLDSEDIEVVDDIVSAMRRRRGLPSHPPIPTADDSVKVSSS